LNRKTTPATNWKNRIVGHGEKPAGEFVLNDLNWRLHPKAQRSALREILSRVGWVTGVIVNATTGHVIDGAARIEEARAKDQATLIPFTQVELSEAEEKEVLLLLDAIGSMATPDDDALTALIGMVGIESADLLAALSAFTDGDLDLTGAEPNLSDPNFNYQSQFGVIVQCADESHQKQVFDSLTEAGYSVRVVVV
jgi:hypothetical protein